MECYQLCYHTGAENQFRHIRCKLVVFCAASNLRDALKGGSLLYVFTQHFHEAAYQADDRQDLLTAINRFLDCSVVLPPSEVRGDELLHSVARFQREMLRKREEQQSGKLQEKKSVTRQDEGQFKDFQEDLVILALIR